jgi:hypothetical protein
MGIPAAESDIKAGPLGQHRMTVAAGHPPRREHRVATAKAMDFPSVYGDLVLALKGITDTGFSLFGYQRARMVH